MQKRERELTPTMQGVLEHLTAAGPEWGLLARGLRWRYVHRGTWERRGSVPASTVRGLVRRGLLAVFLPVEYCVDYPLAIPPSAPPPVARIGVSTPALFMGWAGSLVSTRPLHDGQRLTRPRGLQSVTYPLGFWIGESMPRSTAEALAALLGAVVQDFTRRALRAGPKFCRTCDRWCVFPGDCYEPVGCAPGTWACAFCDDDVVDVEYAAAMTPSGFVVEYERVPR